jgi:hypothetical protein
VVSPSRAEPGLLRDPSPENRLTRVDVLELPSSGIDTSRPLSYAFPTVIPYKHQGLELEVLGAARSRIVDVRATLVVKVRHSARQIPGVPRPADRRRRLDLMRRIVVEIFRYVLYCKAIPLEKSARSDQAAA